MRRDRRVRIGRTQVGDGLSLEPSEGRLALVGEELRDRAAGPRLDALVEVDERRPVPCREPTADDALAAPGQADQHDVHRRSVVPAGPGLVRAGQAVGMAGNGRVDRTGQALAVAWRRSP